MEGYKFIVNGSKPSYIIPVGKFVIQTFVLKMAALRKVLTVQMLLGQKL